MKTIKLNAVVAGLLSAGALLMVAPGVSSAAGEDGLDMHGWRIDAAQVVAANPATGEDSLDIHGWRIDHAQVAAAPSAYIGTSLKAYVNGELGFTDPRPGQGDLENSDGTLGISDPRPGQGDY